MWTSSSAESTTGTTTTTCDAPTVMSLLQELTNKVRQTFLY